MQGEIIDLLRYRVSGGLLGQISDSDKCEPFDFGSSYSPGKDYVYGQQDLGLEGQEDVAKAVLEGVTLLSDSSRVVRIPWTQDPPLMTDDALLENQAAMSALGRNLQPD